MKDHGKALTNRTESGWQALVCSIHQSHGVVDADLHKTAPLRQYPPPKKNRRRNLKILAERVGEPIPGQKAHLLSALGHT